MNFLDSQRGRERIAGGRRGRERGDRGVRRRREKQRVAPSPPVLGHDAFLPLRPILDHSEGDAKPAHSSSIFFFIRRKVPLVTPVSLNVLLHLNLKGTSRKCLLTLMNPSDVALTWQEWRHISVRKPEFLRTSATDSAVDQALLLPYWWRDF
jgi:hypothetical protein